MEKPYVTQRILLTGAALAALLCGDLSEAASGGRSGYSGNPATNGGDTCTACHSGGVVPTVTLSGPTVVEAGSVNSFRLMISGGQEIAGGLGVSASSGTLGVNDPGTFLLDGEITHIAPRSVDTNQEVVFTFDWTAPSTSGSATLYGAGNSVNLAQGTNGDNAAAAVLPVMVTAPGTPLFRVNAGGAMVPTLDSGPDWAVDTGADPSSLHNGGSNAAGFPVASFDASVPMTTPTDIFQNERWDPGSAGDGQEMSWSFPLGAPGTFEVRLYFANGCDCTQNMNDRKFDVVIEGVTVLDDYDIVADAGHRVGVMKSFIVTSDADLNIDFLHVTENPLINGIEIIATDADGFLDADPSELDFALVAINTTSAPEVVSLANLGQAGDQDISLTQIAATGEFSHDLTLQTVSPGASIQFNVNFEPTTLGTDAGTLTIEHDGNNSPAIIALAGQGYDPAAPMIGFSSSNLAGESLANPTSLQFGPDDRLYVSQQNGTILVYDVVRNGPDDYQVTQTTSITLVKNLPNHDDDGSLNTGQTNRQVTGILVAGTAANPVLYVTSSDPRISVDVDSGLDTNSGIISRLTWNGSSWDDVALVRGLPRSEENHSTNGMVMSEDGNMLFVAQGGHTNKGAPGKKFSQTPEYALSGAILSVDLAALGAMPVLTDGSGVDYVYDIPTLDDPTQDPDPNDPFGGNNGLNQAIIVPGGPVQVHAPGFRNPYDLALTKTGRLYTFDNGPNTNWGGLPVGEGPSGVCTNETNEANSTGYGDGLHYITGPGYYGGHGHPTRANPQDSGLNVYEKMGDTWVLTASYDWVTDFPVPPVPFAAANPIECDYLAPGVDNGALTVISTSTNGLAEYTASNFGGLMQGNLLAAAWGGKVHRFELNPAGDAVDFMEVLFDNFGSSPLDIIGHGDGGPFPGTIWVVTHGADHVTIFEPDDYGTCGPLFDGDDDGSPGCGGPDCDDTDPAVYPGAGEVNDGVDNQCPGETGFGLVDEIAGESGFFAPGDKAEYSWPAQPGATSYEVARSTFADFSGDCTVLPLATSSLAVDTEVPAAGQVFHYLVRPLTPAAGSWGEDSAAVERLFSCPNP